MSDLAAENEHWLLLAEETARDFMRQIEGVDDPVKLRAVIALLVQRNIDYRKSILDIIAEEGE